LESGINAVFVPYSRAIIDEEQLFGGALSGIRSLLGEITGERKVYGKV
jgi:hypothetical protein